MKTSSFKKYVMRKKNPLFRLTALVVRDEKKVSTFFFYFYQDEKLQVIFHQNNSFHIKYIL